MWNTVGNGLQPILGAASVALRPLRAPVQPVQLPQKVAPIAPTSLDEIDAAVQRLELKKAAWVALPASARADILEECMHNGLEEAPALAATSVKTKGSYGSGIGEELINFIPVVAGLRDYVDTLRANGRPPLLHLHKRRNGQWAAGVFPKSYLPLLFTNFNAEVWVQPGKEATQGELYRRKDAGEVGEGGVALVLGAGNQVSVVCLDLLHKLVAEDQVVVVKMNPLNESLAPHLARVFEPLVQRGFLEFVFGGAREGQALCEHPLVSSVHITGSADTFNAIVWGSPTAAREGPPKLQKPIGAELGNVTPCIIVPGVWSQSDLEYHADGVLAGLANNCGHNCVATQVLVTDAAWPQREAFLDALRGRMGAVQRRAGWYAGSEAKLAAFKEAFPSAEELGRVDAAAGAAGVGGGGPAACQAPFLLVTGLKPGEARVQQEWWRCVLQEIALPGTGGDPSTFLAAATEFANTQCWGQLAAMVVIHPSVQKGCQDAFEGCLEGLKYGNICVNVPCIAGFAMPATTWGAYPGNTLADIGSGNCYVHNTLMLDHPEKSVVFGPWRLAPLPFWSAAATNSAGTMHWAFRIIAACDKLFPGLLYILGAAWNALRS